MRMLLAEQVGRFLLFSLKEKYCLLPKLGYVALLNLSEIARFRGQDSFLA